jgi:hypothetical protein
MNGDKKVRRRTLPVLGMTTVGLAVGAGSLGLYQGATAEPLKQTITQEQPTWTTAEVKPSGVVQAAAEEPIKVEMPKVPVLPQIPAPAPNTQWPQLPNMPSLGVPTPELPKPIELVPAPTMPTIPALKLPVTPELPKPVETAPMPRPVEVVEKFVAPSLAVPTIAVPTEIAQPAKPVAPPVLIQPGFSPSPDFRLPPVDSGISVKSTPATLTSREFASPNAPGETPMIPSFTTVKSAVLGVALAATPASALGAPDTIPITDAKKDEKKPEAPKPDVVAELKTEIEKLKKDLADEKKLREQTDDTVLGKVNKETGKTEPGLITKLTDFETRLKAIETNLAKIDVKRLEETLAKIDLKLADLAKATTSTAMKPDVKEKPEETGAPKQMPSPKSSIRIINEYPVPISMIINGTSHRIEPSQTKVVEITAGNYTYELLHAGSQPTSATIKESDSVTLRIK